MLRDMNELGRFVMGIYFSINDLPSLAIDGILNDRTVYNFSERGVIDMSSCLYTGSSVFNLKAADFRKDPALKEYMDNFVASLSRKQDSALLGIEEYILHGVSSDLRISPTQFDLIPFSGGQGLFVGSDADYGWCISHICLVQRDANINTNSC
jgi:hypothetical protein